MKISQAYDFERLLKARDELKAAHRVASHGEGLGITIRGSYQDKEMIEAVKAAVVAEFDRRIAAVDAKLIALGVEIDE
ncbi:hypothetical protein [Bradyrhizobium retamae]|uniref:Uncharacterized protein n=1 Tax=Bradyrhizobium retamae TaxID=1300035 RepID=A0A0R3MVM6_9BRAD|nr:hypothetical protein [Bradyrhizobium retamae]KRR21696.1 hypothetical protein CQ13_06495 [Bradyrhizobium retamae]